MGYRLAKFWEFCVDQGALIRAMLIEDSDERQAYLHAHLVRSVVVQGEDGTLRVLC
jgi:hypothetical protein